MAAATAFGERLDPLQLLGGAIVIAAVASVGWLTRRERRLTMEGGPGAGVSEAGA